jgi:hypothetical protein
MDIILTETQIKKLSGELDEELGVPEGILDAGEEIYDIIVDKLENLKENVRGINDISFDIKKDFKISNHTFNEIKVNFEIEKEPNFKGLDLYGMYSQDTSEISDNLKLVSVNEPNKITIGFRVIMNPSLDIDDLINNLKENRKENIPSLTHELKHAFRSVKEKGISPKIRTGYVSVQELRDSLGYIPEINEFLFNSYFIHSIENVVRPTELAAEMRINNVSKKEFLNYFLQTEIIKRLKEIQNFNYDDFKKNLSSGKNIERIKEVLENSNINLDGKTNEEMVNIVLRFILVELVNKKNDLLRRLLTSNHFELLFGFSGEKDKFFRKYIAQTTKYGYDYDKFFRNEEKYFHKVSTMMIKKLAKLYAMVKENPS